MTTDLIIGGVCLLLAVISGGLAGGLVAWKLSRPQAEPKPVVLDVAAEDDTAFTDAEIDIASVAFVEKHDLPPRAAGLLSIRLKNLDRLGRQKGWF